jgi:predicted alpha/beta-fold hydrolase
LERNKIKINKYIRNIKPPRLQQNGHLQTIVPALFRNIGDIEYRRERILTPDDDFLDLDWTPIQGRNLVILCHGLEGNSSKAYIKGAARYFQKRGWSCLAWNYRGCSEEINRQVYFYHAGATNDLETVIGYINHHYPRLNLFLMGFSLGSNLILKYLGEQGSALPENIVKAICFSAPLDLHKSCLQISTGVNRIYSWRFLSMLKHKVLRKAKLYPGYFDLKRLNKIHRLLDFDDQFTAPMHGFKNAADYYHRCSSLSYIDTISIPTLIVNARNDPFLSDSCYPTKTLKDHDWLEMITPLQGGHCGFADRDLGDTYWSEVISWNYFNLH